MKFFDEIRCSIQSGNGGNGCVAARRESGVPFGGPAGGNGGKGGDVYCKGNENIGTLQHLTRKHHYNASDGEPGRTKDQYGAKGEDLLLELPIGTIVRNADTKEVMCIVTDDSVQKILDGGRGGGGNMQFASANVQYPQFALRGEPGHTVNIHLELQLLADVGLIGSPSVGKTTLINNLAHTKAQVAEYHFTTIVPNLGIVKKFDTHFSLVDIPGLIVGAAQGKGLGNSFLRHVLKTKIFALICDFSGGVSAIEDVLNVLNEVTSYIHGYFDKEHNCSTSLQRIMRDDILILQFLEEKEVILEKACIILLNKVDTNNDSKQQKAFIKTCMQAITKHISKTSQKITQAMLAKNVIFISGATGQGLDDFCKFCHNVIRNMSLVSYNVAVDVDDILTPGANYSKRDEHPHIINTTQDHLQYLIDHSYISQERGQFLQVWDIEHKEIARLVFQVPRGNEQAEQRFWQVMDKQGHLKYMMQKKVRIGDILHIVSPYSGEKNRFVQCAR